MTTLKGWITTTLLVVSLLASTTAANAGIIITGRSEATDPCTQSTKVETTSSDAGGIITGLTGIIITGLIGIIITGVKDTPPQTNCGIIITG